MLEYHGGDKLYIPVENIGVLSVRFVEEGGALDRLARGVAEARARLRS